MFDWFVDCFYSFNSFYSLYSFYSYYFLLPSMLYISPVGRRR